MAVKISKIYTKTGDQGETCLVGGVKVSKSSIIVESYGMMDEVNSHMGVIWSWAIHNHKKSHRELCQETETTFERIQNTMFDIGAKLASPPEENPDYSSYNSATDERVLFLENRIDTYREDYDTINSFTLPGGNMLNAYAHVARTSCRRWERVLVHRQTEFSLDPSILVYANRLSDFLYAYSRWVSVKLLDDEKLWKPSND